jgi:hypothetical protein
MSGHRVRSIAFLVGCLIAAGCTGTPPSVVMATPTGLVPITTPQPAMPGGAVGPPPGLEPAAAAPALPGDRSGNYGGTAEPVITGGGLCLGTQRVSNFLVRGNRVHFGGFRGTIAQDGMLQMVFGSQWIIGQFNGATFQGQFYIPGRFGQVGCQFAMNLERVGP